MSTQGPSLLSRATRVFSSTPPPPRPTHWHDSVHRDALVKLWDAIVEVTAKKPQRYGGSSTAIRLAYTYQQICGKFPKLREGDTPLNTAWMEYVLGKALKHPFCTAESMGTWEVLAGSSGPRGNWGPW